ncbi:MAG: 3-hydroxyacyl-ACP dehydratase FabZ [Treponema sp.]|nr:3-hydroxyacyl-ACP dehydratase FabZ [Treponema sp.]
MSEAQTMNIYQISEKIAQRPPFQMIERVTELVPNEKATGIKNVSVNEPYFTGHFPGTPIMPGVLIVESCAQLCSLVIEKSPEDLNDKLYVLLKIDGFKFIKPVIPGDRLEITVNKTKGGGVLVGFDCVVKVDGAVFAKGALTFTTIPKEAVGH